MTCSTCKPQIQNMNAVRMGRLQEHTSSVTKYLIDRPAATYRLTWRNSNSTRKNRKEKREKKKEKRKKEKKEKKEKRNQKQQNDDVTSVRSEMQWPTDERTTPHNTTPTALTIVDDNELGCTSTSLWKAAMMILCRCLSSSGSLSTQCATSLRVLYVTHRNFVWMVRS